MLLHDVLARADDVSIVITVFPTGLILLLPVEKSSVYPVRKKVISLNHVRVNTQAAKHTATDNHYEHSSDLVCSFENSTIFIIATVTAYMKSFSVEYYIDFDNDKPS